MKSARTILVALVTLFIGSLSTYFYLRKGFEDSFGKLVSRLNCYITDDISVDKVNSRLSFSNDLAAMTYTIESSTGGVIASVYSSNFSDQSPEWKEEAIEKIRIANPTTLVLGITSTFDDFSSDIETYVSKIPFQNLHIKIYSEPDNILEQIARISWKKNKDMNLTLEFVNVDRGNPINLFNYTYILDELVERNNNGETIASFQIIYTPLFFEFENIEVIITRPTYGKILRNFPARYLRITGISNTYLEKTRDQQEFAKGQIGSFLDKSTIENILVDSIARKEDGRISFIGF